MGYDTEYKCDFMLRAAAVVGLLTFALFSSGCAFLYPDKIHHVVKPSEQPTARCDLGDREEPADRILGVALSGGGSRAAVFGAAALEALSEHGILGQVSHLSSVSGGSLAASYFLVQPPSCEETATQEAEQACWHDYFSEFKGQMRANYWRRMLLRNSRPWRFSSATRRATSLQEVLDNRFLHGKTFGELGSRPVLLINATSYDETRRFVFSNACLAEGAVDPSGGSTAHAGKRYRIMAEKALAQRALQAFTFSRPQCIRPVPSDLPVSLAVSTSAAFPPLTGPVSIEAPSACDGGEPEWWHLGDGGVIENSGTDSLEEILLRRLTDEGPPLKKALILSVDAGGHPDPEKLKRRKNFKMYSNPPRAGLVVDSPRVRGQAYHDIFWDELVDELAKEGIGYEKITFPYSEAELDDLPGSCSGKMPGEETIRDLLLEIPTDLKIDECDADLLELAAHQLVHETFDDETARRLRSEGLSIHTGRDCAMAH
jgi:predicted acylesterase/phospholipase RssA